MEIRPVEKSVLEPLTEAESNRRRYDTGWDYVLGDRYVEATGDIRRQQRGVKHE